MIFLLYHQFIVKAYVNYFLKNCIIVSLDCHYSFVLMYHVVNKRLSLFFIIFPYLSIFKSYIQKNNILQSIFTKKGLKKMYKKIEKVNIGINDHLINVLASL